MGVLYANDEAPGNVDDATDPAFEQSAQTFVGRVRYDLYAESHVGAIMTQPKFLGSHSRLAGVDTNFGLAIRTALPSGRWELSTATSTGWTPAAISPRRCYANRGAT